MIIKCAKETRKDEDLYYQGAFWIIGESVRAIKQGKFTIVGAKLPCDFDGNYLQKYASKNALTHKRLWQDFNRDYKDKPYNYFPRGRVAIYKGIAYIHLHSLFNQPTIVDAVTREYSLGKLEIEVDCNDLYQGSHYDFILE